jgi:hypothetical protein
VTFTLSLVMLNLYKHLKLKDKTLYSKREKFCSLWLILQNYQMMSHPRRLKNFFNPTLGCFNYLVFSLGWILHMYTCLSGGNNFYSNKRLLFWGCMLHVSCFWVPFESPFGETMWSYKMLPSWWSYHMYSSIFLLLRHRIPMGNAILPSSRKITANFFFKFSKLLYLLFVLFFNTLIC